MLASKAASSSSVLHPLRVMQTVPAKRTAEGAHTSISNLAAKPVSADSFCVMQHADQADVLYL